MPVSKYVQSYLTSKDIPFELVLHRRSESVVQSALNAKVPLMSMAKAVVLKDQSGHNLMAVVPGSNIIKAHQLEKLTQSQLTAIPKHQLTSVFLDCEAGAIPAVGPAFNIETWYDTCLLDQDKLYIESGDHGCLLELSRADFERAMDDCHPGKISELPGGDIQL